MSVDKPLRLASVDAVRAHQRQWLEDTRQRVAAGEPFAICNADDLEEIFTAFDIPALVINYWNSVIGFSERKAPHFMQVLERAGYDRSFFGLGFAATLEPEEAPWGGLPKPALIVGTTRSDAQLRLTEIWARAAGCECYPLDFSWVSQYSHPLPHDWWNYHRSRSDEMIDMPRARLRREQLEKLVEHLETKLGRKWDPDQFRELMQRLNRQMEVWQEAMDIAAAARPLPVSLRDQIAMYQTMWQRGTPENLAMVEAFRDEVRANAASGVAVHPRETSRLYLATSGNDPAYHDHIRERWGAAIVSSRYAGIAPMYARDLEDDPLMALAKRQLFLFDKEPYWEVFEAKRWGAQTLIAVEDPNVAQPTHYREVTEAAGLHYLALTPDERDPVNLERIDALLSGIAASED